MTTVSKAIAFGLGALLYFAEERLLGYLAAVTVPKAYFALFGAHKVLALTLEEAVVMALPASLLALGWGLATTKLVRASPFRVVAWVIAGLVVAWFGVELEHSVDPQFASSDRSSSATMLSLSIPPIWAVVTAMSAPLGLLMAGLIARRIGPIVRRMDARPLR